MWVSGCGCGTPSTWSPAATGGKRWRAVQTPAATCHFPPAFSAPSAAPALAPARDTWDGNAFWIINPYNFNPENLGLKKRHLLCINDTCGGYNMLRCRYAESEMNTNRPVCTTYWFHQQAHCFWLLPGCEFTQRDFMMHSCVPRNPKMILRWPWRLFKMGTFWLSLFCIVKIQVTYTVLLVLSCKYF